MDIGLTPEAMGLGLYQTIVFAIALVVFAFLAFRASRAFARAMETNQPMTPTTILEIIWAPVGWLAVMAVVAVFATSMQAYGPRLAIPKTPITVNAPQPGADIQDFTPVRKTDEERLKQQRSLDEETRSRVELDDAEK